MLGIFLSVILLLGQIETAMNSIWHVQDGRSALRKLTDYLTLMVLLPLALNVALAAGTVLGSESLTGQIDRFIPAAWIKIFLLNGVPILVLSATLFVMYVFFPNTKPKALPTMIGALLAGFLWFAIQNIYISLQVGVSKYNAIYGSFATIPLFLAWVYLGWLFVLIGAQVAFAIQKNNDYQLVRHPPAPALQISSALDLCSYVTSRFTRQQKTRVADIQAAYPAYEDEMLEHSVELLVAGGILHHAEETGCLMPSRPPESISNAQVIESVLGTDPPPTMGGRKTAKAVEAAVEALPEPIEEPEKEDVETGGTEADTHPDRGV
jgi:membrane protein